MRVDIVIDIESGYAEHNGYCEKWLDKDLGESENKGLQGFDRDLKACHTLGVVT